MTEDEILAAADAIKDKRARMKRGADIFNAPHIQICIWDGSSNRDAADRLTVEPTPKLAALLCKTLGVEELTKRPSVRNIQIKGNQT
ncbi:hypothetical protein JQX09_17945 [Sulfitobacter pseudonitzschiae]|uniref:Uncharacterized protein n=1 Tax=Pseudosulfitobacter pseudonitzschiae TaxID=1402135 RepID=A0A9Q2NKS1_9RHOB|nr:hypothetical protein [Pseudosulfitobacter pseudonitzschiae]MBM2293814.1 hypothetical protein [Pseudosulfitobacter pseudonitzschiae]MBM2298731.1 hypothetical protein [Pseudosulfitobacter pseudonitzschiae]MBM2303646.1 hypothetical protein [Pseudosulfitobacter pseudonitzschiae]MBM2313428.1 hypothetical protein [Pseudosulfitobacter pseudonitzschiae]MBM2318342.1 hypothetical protein [Pseudosulfitobacter pseudonitzschiae]